jgi:hypothetical protein
MRAWNPPHSSPDGSCKRAAFSAREKGWLYFVAIEQFQMFIAIVAIAVLCNDLLLNSFQFVSGKSGR